MAGRVRTLLVVLFLAGCMRPPVTDDVALDFSRGTRTVMVTAATEFTAGGGAETKARLEAARSAALNGTDPWAVRLGRVNAESDRVTFERSHGRLTRAIRSVTIAEDDLQQVFSDSSITVSLTNGEGWRELRLYPGTSSRATREQQAHFDTALVRWSRDAARYFNALQELYGYMDQNPQRARFLFAAVLDEKGVDGSDPVVTEEEQPLVDAVNVVMEEIASQMDDEEGDAAALVEDADLVFNPFPARLTIRVPGDVLASEGFSKDLTIEPVDLGGTIMALEGRWVEPDPLALLLRDRIPTAEELASQNRRAEPVVSAASIEEAVREKLVRPRTYMVRWRE